ncbi:hypothetical protein NUSPORA_02597 [Nucleospora cyclopteri]
MYVKKLRKYDLLANELSLLIQGRDNSVCFNLVWCNNKISQYVRQVAFHPSKNTSIHPNYTA